jgi:uncharacterized protein (TIRG00374 family)
MLARARLLRLTISLAVSLIFLYLTFFKPQIGALARGEDGLATALFGHSRFDLNELGSAIADAHWGYILGAGVLFFATLFIRAIRWRMMLRPMCKISFSEVFGAMNIGYMANNVLPLRMGELYRAQVVHQMTGLSRSAAFGSIVLERLIDLLFLIPFVGLAIALYPLPPSLQQGAYIVAGAAFAVTIFFVWLVGNRHRALSFTRGLVRVFPHKVAEKIVSLVDTFTAGLGVLGRADLYLWISIISIVLWAMYTAIVYLMLSSMGLMSADFPLVFNDRIGSSLVILVITTVGFVIPAAPGGVGTYHGLAVLGLSLFAIPGDRAAGFAIILHALNYVPLTGLGLIFFWKLGFSFKGSKGLNEEFDRSEHALTLSRTTSGEKQRLS